MGIAIWVGVAILTVALLILMRTRWGQAQPLSKCVVLSVFAHVLLLLFAYGTRLLDVRTPLAGDDAIQLSFVTTDRPPREGDEKSEPQPWDDFLPGETPEPEAVDTQRMNTDGEPISRSDKVGAWTMGTAVVPRDDVSDDQPTPPIAEHQIPLPPRPSQSLVQATPIEPPPQPRRVEKSQVPPIPNPKGPDRMPTMPVVSRPPDHPTQPQLPTEIFDMGSRMQTLADVQTRSETADALVGSADQLSQSENRGAGSVDSTGKLQELARNDRQATTDLVTLPPGSSGRAARAAAATELMEEAITHPARRLGDGQLLPEAYRLRRIPQRQELAVSLGGSAKAAAAVEASLAWLAAEQEQDGRWDSNRWGAGIEHKVAGHDREGAGTEADTGITGLAILAFLANGQTHLEGKYRKNVQRGLEYLLRSQAADGNLAGPARLYARMYCHGMASLALSEALALTGDVRIRPYVERAVSFTVKAQHPTTGGWRYQPGDQGDMSQFGWQVMALKSASLAGIPIGQETREGMLHFLQRCEHGIQGGMAGYKPGAPPSRSMTAEALVCRYFLDLAPSDALVHEATEFLMGELPQPGQPNLYYWYYGTLALFQVQGEPWQQWNAAMQRQLLQKQRTDGHLAGSWDPDTIWGAYGGRVYSTAMATLCLEVYYRYLPLTALASNDTLR